MEQAPLIDLSHVKLIDLIREVDAETKQPIHRAVERILRDLKDPDGVISAFGSFTGT